MRRHFRKGFRRAAAGDQLVNASLKGFHLAAYAVDDLHRVLADVGQLFNQAGCLNVQPHARGIKNEQRKRADYQRSQTARAPKPDQEVNEWVENKRNSDCEDGRDKQLASEVEQTQNNA